MSKEIGKRLASGQKPPRKGRLTRQQIILLVIVAVLAVVLAAALAVRSLFVRPEIPVRNNPNKNADLDGDGNPDGPEAIDYGDGIRPRGGDGERKSEDYWTVLILGRDTGGGGLTDTMLLASYDVTNQKATVMSIPRDTMVNVPWDVKKLNSVYNGYGGGEKGMQHLYKEIAQLVGFEPDFQVVVEWEAVGEIVDAIGGVYFDVPRDMNYDDPYQDLHIHQTKGYRLLSGDDAMQVLRYRHDNRKNGVMLGYPEGDVGRIKTQQAFLKAMAEQVLQPKNMTKVGPLIEAFNKNVETDMSFQNILWFGKSAVMGGLKMEDVNFITMPHYLKDDVYSRSYGTQGYVMPNARKLLDLVNNELSPFKEVFTLSDLDIMSVNADGSLSSSTGYVEDKRAAVPPPKPEPEEEEPVVDENGNPIDPETGLPLDPETGEPLVTDPAGGESGGGTESPGGSPPGTGGASAPPEGGTAALPESPGTAEPPPPENPGGESSGGQDPALPESPGTAEPPSPENPGGESSGGQDPALPDDSGQNPAGTEAPPVPEAPQEPSAPGFVIIEPPPSA